MLLLKFKLFSTGTVTYLKRQSNLVFNLDCMCGSRGGGGGGGGGRGSRLQLKNHKNIGILSNTGADPLKNHNPTKRALSVGPSSAHQRNAI